MAPGIAGTPPDRHHVDHRALLFSSKFGRPGSVNARGLTEAARYAAHERAIFEARNDELVEELRVKAAALRECSLEIRKEVSSSNSLLGSMDPGFARLQSVLSSATAQLQKVVQEPGSRHGCLLVLFVVMLMLALYMFVAHGRFRNGVRVLTSVPSTGDQR